MTAKSKYEPQDPKERAKDDAIYKTGFHAACKSMSAMIQHDDFENKDERVRRVVDLWNTLFGNHEAEMQAFYRDWNEQ